MNYQDADALCRRGGKADGVEVDARTIANNTRIIRIKPTFPGGHPHFHVRLHKTDILTFWQDGRVRYDTGGWLTMTTRERMNRFGPDGFRVISDYEHRSGRWLLQHHDDTEPFVDGLTVETHAYGWWVVPGTGVSEGAVERENLHNKRIHKLITRYVDELPSAAGLINICGNVDAFGTAVPICALCITKVEKPKLPPRPGTKGAGNGALSTYAFTLIGDAMGDMQHLIEHMIDRHYHKGMVLAALTYCGYPRPIDLAAVDRDNRMTKRALRKYLRARLTVGAVATANGRRPIDAKPWNLAAEMAG